GLSERIQVPWCKVIKANNNVYFLAYWWIGLQHTKKGGPYTKQPYPLPASKSTETALLLASCVAVSASVGTGGGYVICIRS
ncbi:hypothetical protein CPB84DRAFT_1767794, partial [Gymnopilus junonius]